MICRSWLLGLGARWDLPRLDVFNRARLQPGYLEVGPDEKQGLSGFVAGSIIFRIINYTAVRDVQYKVYAGSCRRQADSNMTNFS